MPAGLNAGTAWIKVAPDMRPFSAGVRSQATETGRAAGSRFSDGFKSKLKVGAAIGGALAVAGTGKFLKSAISEASDLGESINAVNVTFGKAAGGINKLGREAADSLGLSRSQFNGIAVQFSAFASTIAGKGGDVTGVMSDLTTRGADFASVMNLEVNDAMRIFQSGLAGETEPLRKYGIDLSAAAVENHALAAGIASAGEKLTENQKVQARYSLLMKQTSKVQGDFKNTSDSLANSQRILGANFDDIQASVGKVLIPTLERLSSWALKTGIPALKSLGSFIQRNASTIKILGGLVLAGATAWGVYTVATKVAVTWTKRQAIAQALLNRALMLNPVGLVITALVALGAAFVIAYKKSETFRKVVDAAWAGIRKATSYAWNGVIQPVFKAYVLYLKNVLFPIVRYLYDRVVKPIFTSVGRHIANVWKSSVRPTFEALKSGVGKIQGAFSSAVSAIARIWNGLKAAAMGPVKFVVETVYNKGIVPMLEKIPGVSAPRKVYLSAASTYSNAGGTYQGPGVRRASGGVLPGYSPGRDVHDFYSPTAGSLHLSGGEGIMRPEFVRAVGGKRGVDRLNRKAMHGALRDPARAFFLGGVMPMVGTTSVSRHTSGYPWATWAGDLNGIGNDTGKSAVAWKSGTVASTVALTGSYGRHIRVNHAGQSTLYAHLSQFSSTPGQRVSAGQKIGEVGSTGNSTGPHLHFEVKGGNVAGGTGVGGGGPSPKESMLAKFGGAVKAALSFAKMIPGRLSELAGMGGWGGVMRSMTRAVVNGVGGFINDKIPNRFLPDNPIPKFDSGGYMRPGMAYNGSGRPEAVFTEPQWATLRAAVRPALSGQRLDLAQRARAGDRQVITITNWRDGTGYMESIANGAIAGQERLGHVLSGR